MKQKALFEKLDSVALSLTRSIGSVGSLIIHTLIFIMCFAAIGFGFNASLVMLILTTIVSLEAIYLSIFIQMSVNRTEKELKEVGQDIDEIQEDIEDIQEDVEEIQEDMEEIQEDIEEIQEDVEEVSHDIDEIQEDIDEVSKELDDLNEDYDKETVIDVEKEREHNNRLDHIERMIQLLSEEVRSLKK